jgi:hypothetical protein
VVLVGTRSIDGTYYTSKELHVGDSKENNILAYLGGLPCPNYCGPVPPPPPQLGMTLVDRGEKSMSVI